MSDETPAEITIGWAGAITGLAGAMLLSNNNEWSQWAYVPFVASSVLMFIWSIKRRHLHAAVLQGGFTLINVNGAINWLF